MARTERQQFITRLAVYLVGIAIGCLILGLFAQARKAEMQRQAATQAAAEPVQAGSSPITPK